MVGSSQATSKKNLIKLFSSDINTLRFPGLFSRTFYFNSFRCFSMRTTELADRSR